jgi:hypothetical protein
MVLGSPDKKFIRLQSSKWTGGVAQASSSWVALSSNPSLTKKRKKKENLNPMNDINPYLLKLEQ